VATHEERWRGNLDRPPDNFFPANACLAHAERAPAARVAAWVFAGVALLALPGLERALTTINDQMAIVPLGLSRILGLTFHLGVPTALPMWLLTAGGILGMLGVLAAAGRRRQPGVEVGGAELDGR